MIEKIDGFEINFNEKSKRIINIDIGDEILNKLIFPFNKFDVTALEYKPFTRFTIAKSLDDLSNNKHKDHDSAFKNSAASMFFDEEVEQQVEGEFDAIQEQALESLVEEL